MVIPGCVLITLLQRNYFAAEEEEPGGWTGWQELEVHPSEPTEAATEAAETGVDDDADAENGEVQILRQSQPSNAVMWICAT